MGKQTTNIPLNQSATDDVNGIIPLGSHSPVEGSISHLTDATSPTDPTSNVILGPDNTWVGVSGVQGDCGPGRYNPSGGGGGGGGFAFGSARMVGGGKVVCDPECLILAALGCVPGIIGCTAGAVGCAKGFREGDSMAAVDCIMSGLGCFVPPLAIPACVYGILRCIAQPTGPASLEEPVPMSGAPGADPLAFYRPGVRAMLDLLNELTGSSDEVWINSGSDGRTGEWFARFQAAAHPESDGGRHVSAAERAELLGAEPPPGVPPGEINRFLDRWNRTLDNWAQGILKPSDAPPDANRDFIDMEALADAAELFEEQNQFALDAGFSTPVEAIVETIRILDAAGQAGGVCARVRLQLDQEAVLSREAFRATLELENRDVATLENIAAHVRVTDSFGNEAGELFGITPPEITGIGSIDGGSELPTGTTAVIRWTIIPTVDAAPVEPVEYFVSGQFSYVLNGVAVTVPLSGRVITVHPTPLLALRYFHERDVFANDPHTDVIEPSIPFNLGVMVQNKGAGPARNFRIVSGQPEIIENEKGLLIDFEIIATEVAGQHLAPTLTANFGTIGPGETAIARWLMIASLHGHFISYSATFEHLDGMGNPRLSLIEDVSIHETIRVIWPSGISGGGQPAFLVNDIPDPFNRPDTIYLADGTTEPVAVVTEALVDGVLSPENLQVGLTAPMPPGWAYLRVPDPADGEYLLVAIERSDGLAIPVDVNAWITDRTFIGQGTRPVRENILHLLDLDSTGAYTLTYVLAPELDLVAPTSSIAALPPASGTAIMLNWSGEDNVGGSGIAFFDIFVSEDGGPFQLWRGGTTATTGLFHGTIGRTYAFYSIATDRAGNRQPVPPGPHVQTTVTEGNRPPVLAAITDRTVVAGGTLVVDLEAEDPDGDAITFSILPGAPAGMTVHPATGRVTWITGPAHAGGVFSATAAAIDNGLPRLGAERSFQVTVLESDTPPELAPIPDFTIAPNQTLSFTAAATDFRLPPRGLTFSLETGAPEGAEIDPQTGLFTWTPAETQAPGTNQVTLRVTAEGTPPLSASRDFTIYVTEPRIRPAVVLSPDHLEYTGGMGPVVNDGVAGVLAPDTPHFGGGALVVRFAENDGTPHDRLGLLPGGLGNGPIQLMEDLRIKWGLAFIGSLSGGQSGDAPLIATFNENASPAAVVDLLRHLVLETTAADPLGQSRALEFAIADGLDPVPSDPSIRMVRMVDFNRPPFADHVTASALRNGTLHLALLKLLAAASDPDGDPLAVASVAPMSEAGGLAVFDADHLVYTPPQGFVGVDRFAFVVSDGRGGTAEALVIVDVREAASPGVPVEVVRMQNGVIRIALQSIPWTTHALEVSENLREWERVATAMASPSGKVVFEETPPAGVDRRFYRIIRLGN